MSGRLGRYDVITYADHYEVIDKATTRHDTVMITRSRQVAHNIADQLEREHKAHASERRTAYCATCRSQETIVKLRPVIWDAPDPTQTYDLACGHVGMDL